jgi:hypothetical protein
MSVSVRHVLNAAVVSRAMRKAGKRKQLIWTGIFECINVWPKRKKGANIEVGM